MHCSESDKECSASCSVSVHCALAPPHTRRIVMADVLSLLSRLKAWQCIFADPCRPSLARPNKPYNSLDWTSEQAEHLILHLHSTEPALPF